MLRELAVGATAALRTPFWLIGRRVEGLLDRSGGGPVPGESAQSELPRPVTLATRAARGVIRRLAGIPRSPWRNTCLYRSIAECLVLRHYGVPAVIRIGVRNEAPPHGPIVAHAWVVYPGCADTERHIPLSLAAGLVTREFGVASDTSARRAAKVGSPRAARDGIVGG